MAWEQMRLSGGGLLQSKTLRIRLGPNGGTKPWPNSGSSALRQRIFPRSLGFASLQQFGDTPGGGIKQIKLQRHPAVRIERFWLLAIFHKHVGDGIAYHVGIGMGQTG